MKRKLSALLLGVALSVASSVTSWGQNKVGGSIPAESQAVDLGLSVKWAPWNIGASQPSDYGDYFAWGEVVPKKDEADNYLSYDLSTYKWMADGKSDWKCITKYQAKDDAYTAIWYDYAKIFTGDDENTLVSSDDAATANWGDKWRMPTKSEFAELCNVDNCEWTWTDNYNESGHSGYVVKSKKAGYEDAVLFLPAAGSRRISDLNGEGSNGCYWLSVLCPWLSNNSMYLRFSSSNRGVDYNYRSCGFSVRAVEAKGPVPNVSEAIDLGLSVKWAPWNIGARNPSEYGEYFMWGKATPKKDADGNLVPYDWSTYSLSRVAGGKNITLKYNEADGKSILDSSDDAATVNWGDNWRMPTQAEFAELYNWDNCEWTWTDNYNESGHSGYVIKSKKAGYEDAVLFLPAAGRRWSSSRSGVGLLGCYWSAELNSWDSDLAKFLYFGSISRGTDGNGLRYFGFPVRAVCPLAE